MPSLPSDHPVADQPASEDAASDELDFPTLEARTARVPESAAGRRFDAALAELFPEFSRSRLSLWIKSGDALLDGQPVRGRDPVRGGEIASLNVVLDVQTQAEPENIPLDVLFEDDQVIVLNKPAGLVVHPGAGNPNGTLVNALLYFDPTLSTIPRAGIVHRLDKDTSGVMVVARTLPAHTALVAQLSERGVHRQYLAVVVGALVSGGTATASIDRHPHDRIRMAAREGGRDAVTHYRLRERFRAHTALECRLETGRTHQIRVHMAHLKHPIVGDPMYGGPLKLPKGATTELIDALRGFRRQALHAQTLEFAHPISGEPVRCTAPVPDDMVHLLKTLQDDAAAHAITARR